MDCVGISICIENAQSTIVREREKFNFYMYRNSFLQIKIETIV